MRRRVKFKNLKLYGDVYAYQVTNPTKEGIVIVEIWKPDDEKIGQYQDAIEVLARIVGLHPVQIVERVWEKEPKEGFWEKRIATIYMPKDWLEEKDGND